MIIVKFIVAYDETGRDPNWKLGTYYSNLQSIQNMKCEKLEDTTSVLDNSGHFDRTWVLRIVMKSGLKKLVKCESYLYILVYNKM